MPTFLVRIVSTAKAEPLLHASFTNQSEAFRR